MLMYELCMIYTSQYSVMLCIVDVEVMYKLFDIEYQGIAFGNINFNNNRVYYMAVLLDINNKVKLLSFQQN